LTGCWLESDCETGVTHQTEAQTSTENLMPHAEFSCLKGMLNVGGLCLMKIYAVNFL
jgi:hypothetical protein